MKKSCFIFAVFLFSGAFAQTYKMPGKVFDSRNKPLQNTRITLTDSCSGEITEAISSDSGYFYLEIPDNCSNLWLRAEHDESCESAYIPYECKLSLRLKDTLKIFLSNLFIDYELPNYRFKENSLLFTVDSVYHDLTTPDSSFEFEWLDKFAWLYNCDPFTQVEVVCIYTKAESAKHKDTLATKRAELLIDYLVQRGMPREVFVIRTEPFRDKRHINADGTRMSERDAVYFRILKW